MSPVVIAAVISGAGVVFSMVTSAFIAGMRWGQVRADLAVLQHGVNGAATKEEMNNIRTDVAEIKGMFKMVPKEFTAS